MASLLAARGWPARSDNPVGSIETSDEVVGAWNGRGRVAEERKKKVAWSAAWREARDLIWARRGRLGLGFVLMAVNRLAGLVLPGDLEGPDRRRRRPSSRRPALAARRWRPALPRSCRPSTGFALSQVLGLAAQRSITDMRREVRAARRAAARRLLRLDEDRRPHLAHHDRRRRHPEPGRQRPRAAGRQHRHRHRGARRAVLAQLAPDDGHAAAARRVRRRHGAGVHRGCGRSSASAARSTPRSRAGSPRRWAASASSRRTPPRQREALVFAKGVHRLFRNVAQLDDRASRPSPRSPRSSSARSAC